MQREEPGRRNDKMKSESVPYQELGQILNATADASIRSHCEYALLTCVSVWATGVTYGLLV